MITRFAQISDVPGVVELLREFSTQARVGFRPWDHSRDLPRMIALVQNWQYQHYVRVSVDQHQVQGVLIAELGTDFWDPERRILQERAWYVRESARETRASAQLWRAWQQDTEQYLSRGRVAAVLMSTQGSATDFDPGHRGWRMIEQTWMKEI